MFTSLIFTLALALSTPCEFEDSANCYWSADTQGNQTGATFVDIQGVAYYLEGK